MAPDPEQALRAEALAQYQALLAPDSELTRLMLAYQSGIDEVTTRLATLQREFEHLQASNPIEHVTSRLKSPRSLLDKARRRGAAPTLAGIQEVITDIAGVRVVCSFISDVYRVSDALCSQPDLGVREVEDYIAAPKPSGYRSLHVLLEVPVFLSDRSVRVPVEVQFRTIAMDFWASLEHKINYKYDRVVPTGLIDGLRDAARTAAQLDRDMERLHLEVQAQDSARDPDPRNPTNIENLLRRALAGSRDGKASADPAGRPPAEAH